jgi:hypothetical protein
VKKDAVINGEKSLRTNKAWLRKLAALKIATIQRHHFFEFFPGSSDDCGFRNANTGKFSASSPTR